MTCGSKGVRPTRRCISDLELALPNLGVPLDELDHAVIAAGQSVPEQRNAGGAQRILALSDRVWFKIKVGDQRAAVTELSFRERPSALPVDVGAWWIGASGRRRADSPRQDFYASIMRECTTGRTVSSVGLLPTAWDWKRLTAEQAVAWRREMKLLVAGLIVTSFRTERVAVAEFRNHRVSALIRDANGPEAYLAIIAEGVPDPEIYALLLDCVPGVAAADWQPEPSSVAGLEPAPGEIIWSTLLSPETLRAVLDRVEN